MNDKRSLSLKPKPKPKRKRKEIPTWYLGKRPTHFWLTLVDGRLRIHGGCTSMEIPAGASVSVDLNRTETEQFFRELGCALGYKMSPERRSFFPRAGAFRSAKGDVVCLYAGVESRRGRGQVNANVNQRRALRLFKEMAGYLGWELSEEAA